MGYLIDVEVSDISALPDAYAAGYIQGHTQAREISEYRKPESLLEQLGTIPGSYTFASTLDGRRDQSP